MDPNAQFSQLHFDEPNESITRNAVTAQNGALGYTLDPVGNRQVLTSTLGALTAQSNTFDANDRMAADTYDSNGNTLTGGGHTFRYEFEDRLTQFDNGVVQYIYDGAGNRVARTESGATIRYLIDDLNPTGYAQVLEEVVGGSVVRQYSHGVMRISQRQLIGATWQLSVLPGSGLGLVSYVQGSLSFSSRLHSGLRWRMANRIQSDFGMRRS